MVAEKTLTLFDRRLIANDATEQHYYDYSV